MAKNVFINDSATTEESNYDMSVHEVYFVSNDSIVGDVYLNFDNSMETDTNYMILKPQESFNNLDTSCKTLYVKSDTETVDFRVYGKKY